MDGVKLVVFPILYMFFFLFLTVGNNPVVQSDINNVKAAWPTPSNNETKGWFGTGAVFNSFTYVNNWLSTFGSKLSSMFSIMWNAVAPQSLTYLGKNIDTGSIAMLNIALTVLLAIGVFMLIRGA